MKKLLITLIFLPLIAGLGFVAYKWVTMPEQTIPYPYYFADKEKHVQAEKIVLVGDRGAAQLAKFIPTMEEEISKGLVSKLKISDLSQKHAGLHRTLKKLKEMKPFPKIILYMGATEEDYEHRFRTEDVPNILENFKLFESDTVQTWLLISPHFAKFIYKPVERILLRENIIQGEELADTHRLIRRELTYKLYTEEFKEMVDYIKAKGSILVVINHPLNLDQSGKKICEVANQESWLEIKKQVLELMQKGDSKSALNLLLEQKSNFSYNTEFFYYLGQNYKAQGEMNLAIKNLEMGMALDCSEWRGSEVFHSIQKKIAQEKEIFYFDFYQMTKDDWGKNETFLDDFYPQNLYYERAAKALGSMLKNYLKI